MEGTCHDSHMNSLVTFIILSEFTSACTGAFARGGHHLLSLLPVIFCHACNASLTPLLSFGYFQPAFSVVPRGSNVDVWMWNEWHFVKRHFYPS